MIYLSTTASEPLPLSWLIAGGIIAVSFIVLVRWIASKYQDNASAKARLEFETLDGFQPGPVHAFGSTAIAYDDAADVLAVWHKGEGASILSPEDVDSFFVGEVTKKTLTRYDAAMMNSALIEAGGRATVTAQTSRIPYLILFADKGQRAIFKVGFVSTQDQPEWLEILTGILGKAKARASVD
jgi:hypothetical protein